LITRKWLIFWATQYSRFVGSGYVPLFQGVAVHFNEVRRKSVDIVTSDATCVRRGQCTFSARLFSENFCTNCSVLNSCWFGV